MSRPADLTLGYGPPPMADSYSGGPFGTARPLRSSPPGSQHPSSSTDGSRPSGGASSVGRPPSSASSFGRSSDGRMGMGPPGQRDSARVHVNPHNEDALQRHYGTLKVYLGASLRDEKGNMKPNRARDKLLRLSVTQFMELSTDVFDELNRREDQRMQRVANVPPSLPPKQNFHPKRNQARQKLSTLPTERFRQLATDVFYELERRIPRFAGGGDGDRPMSSASSRSMRPPPGFRGGSGPRPPMSPGFGPPSRAGTGDFGRPLAKTFQSNTIVPNKSTMVEDDEDEDDALGDFAGISDRFSRDTAAVGRSNTEDLEKIKAQEGEIAVLKESVEALEGKLSMQERDGSAELVKERTEWQRVREELEQKHADAQQLHENLRRELDQLHRDKTQDERDIRSQHDRSLADLRAQLDAAHAQTDDLHTQLHTHQQESEQLRAQLSAGLTRTASTSDYERRIDLLQDELATQQKLTNEVRDEATTYLREMRDLSRQNDAAIEQEEKSAAQLAAREREIDEWRQRYARVKAQNKSLRASTMGLGLQTSFDAGSLFRKEALLSDGGLVKDVDVTRFQLAVDELLRVARQTSTDAMLDGVKNVVICVQALSSAVGTDGYPTPSPSPLSPGGPSAHHLVPVAKLKARVTGTANSLITATKQHASAAGLSPVALLDAAASNLTSAVVELVKAVGIRPSPHAELQDAELDLQPSSSSSSHHPQDNHHQQQDYRHTPSDSTATTDPAIPDYDHLADPHDSLSSFYDDQHSPAGSPHQIAAAAAIPVPASVSIHSNPTPIHVQLVSAPAPPPPASADATIAAAEAAAAASATLPPTAISAPSSLASAASPLGLGRSGTMKKWFGWGGGKADENPASPVSPAVVGVQGGGNGAGGSGSGYGGEEEQEFA